MKTKHKPVRKCICCGEKFFKSDLIKIVLKDGEIAVDKTHKSEGRGAYICKNPDCIDLMIKKRCLNRAFKRQIDTCVYEHILEEINRE